MRYSTTYRDGRILGLGDMPLDLLSEKISSLKYQMKEMAE